jgi:hypothetical protein
MPARSNAALTRRRLGGAVLLLAGIAVAAVVLWPGGGDDNTASAPKKLPVRFVSVPPLGLGFAHPTSWSRSVRNRIIGLRAPGGSVLVFFSSPVAKPQVRRVKTEAQRQLRKQFAPAKIVREGPGRLGDREATSFELKGRDKSGPVRALVLVASTAYRTYAVTVLTGAKPSRRRLGEERGIIATVRLGKPQLLRSKKP